MIIIETNTSRKNENRKWEFTGILEGKAHFKLIKGYAGGYQNYSTKIKRYYGETYINGSWTFGFVENDKDNGKIFMDKYIKRFIEDLNIN